MSFSCDIIDDGLVLTRFDTNLGTGAMPGSTLRRTCDQVLCEPAQQTFPAAKYSPSTLRTDTASAVPFHFERWFSLQTHYYLATFG